MVWGLVPIAVAYELAHYAALLSQLPVLVLMVAYTSLGLWIMAQPIVG
jgi:hypothetical protein